jgi:hypothetical protein
MGTVKISEAKLLFTVDEIAQQHAETYFAVDVDDVFAVIACYCVTNTLGASSLRPHTLVASSLRPHTSS